MERLKERYKNSCQALTTLNDALQKYKALDPNDCYFAEVRDSVIKRFEYSLDTFWKLNKEYLEKIHGLEAPSSPKGVFKICAEIKIVSESELQELLEMIDDRNLTSHTYKVALAQEISEAAFYYHEVIFTILQRLKI